MDISLQILLFIALLILLAKAVGGLSARVGMPLVLGELLAGVILGPTVLNVWRFPWFAAPASTAGHAISLAAILKVLADMGVVVLMFLAGLETDTAMMRAAVGPAFWSALGGVILPMVAGCAVSRLAGFAWGEAVFIGTILTATSVSITAQTLMNLGRLRTRAGSTILGAAVIDDVLGLMALSVVIAMEPKAGHVAAAGWTSIAWPIGRMVLFLGLAFWLGPRLIRALFRNPGRFQGPHTGVAAALAVTATEVPLTVAPPLGLVIDTDGGGTLFTVTLTGLEVAELPAVSTARAVIAWAIMFSATHCRSVTRPISTLAPRLMR